MNITKEFQERIEFINSFVPCEVLLCDHCKRILKDVYYDTFTPADGITENLCTNCFKEFVQVNEEQMTELTIIEVNF